MTLALTAWQFGPVPRRPFTAPNLYDLPAVTEWLPATVPGNVRVDLLHQGRIPDPFFAQQYRHSLWVDEVDWWYRCRLPAVDLPAGGRGFLVFHGLDYLSAIFVDGQEMARRQGMFSRQVIDITPALRRNPAVEIGVRLWGSSALPRRRLNRLQRLWQALAGPLYGSWVGIYPDRSATLKCQISFGWDFAPPIRTTGIWNEVTLRLTGPVAILDTGLLAQPAAAGPRGDVTGLLHLVLDADLGRPVVVTVQVRPANFAGPPYPPARFQLDLPAGRSEHRLKLHLPQAARWHTWDRGRPHLYDVQVNLTAADGRPLDSRTLRTGFRSLEVQNWQFRLNGQRLFIRGLNWVPADLFPGRLRREDYERLLRPLPGQGVNLLRVWGGGLREKPAFYHLCNELGLLVWQEFPFACMFLGSYPRDREFLSLVQTECGDIVRQLRSHPSLALWCGGNEFSRRRNRPLLDTLARVVRHLDGTRPFIPTSPGPGDVHEWRVWHGLAPLQTYQRLSAVFLSEFGLQAPPHPDTLSACLPDPAAGWDTRHADLPKLTHYAAPFLPSSGSLAAAARHAQAVGLQLAIEQMRRGKGRTGGVCVWQYNEPWPAISWALVDYFGRPKPAWFGLADWYNPVLVSLDFPAGRAWQPGDRFTADIWAINDTRQTLPDCRLRVEIDGTAVHVQPVDLPADSAVRVGRLVHRLEAAPRQVSLTLHRGDDLLACNRYPLDWSDLRRPPLLLRLRRALADWTLR